MNRKLTRPVLSLTLAGSLMSLVCGAALADTRPQAFTAGEVIALENTPHIFVSGDDGQLHLAADAKVLAGRDVAWSTRREVPVSALREYNLGAPLLSMSLVRIGTAIYLPQTQTDGGAPVLRLIGSIADLGLIGVNTENYGRLVLTQGEWEARYGMRVSDLRFEDLSLDGQHRVRPPTPEVTVATSESSSQSDFAPATAPSLPGFLMPGAVVDAPATTGSEAV